MYLQCKAQSNYMVIILKLFLFNDTSFIKIGVCYQELLSLEFNFHYPYSKHSVMTVKHDVVRTIINYSGRMQHAFTKLARNFLSVHYPLQLKR